MKTSSPAFILPFLLGGLLATASADTANPDSTELRDRTERASRESIPVEDDGDGRASPDARPTDDRMEQKANPDSAQVRDSVDDKASPDAAPTAVADRVRQIPATAGEVAVREAYEEMTTDLNPETLRLETPEQAMQVIGQVLGADGDVSEAEAERPDLLPGAVRAGRQNLEAAAGMLERVFRGEPMEDGVPEFIRSWVSVVNMEDAGGLQVRDGRRQIVYASRGEVPAVLLASGVLNRVRIDSKDDGWVLSYPVKEGRVVTSELFNFAPASTALGEAAPHDLLLALSLAMRGEGLADMRFAIECHSATTRGGPEERMMAQLRAESVARLLVRAGIEKDRLLPIGLTAQAVSASAEGDGVPENRILIVPLSPQG